MRKESAAFDFYNKQQVSKYHNYTTIGQYSQISDGFYRMYKEIGWEGTASGITNADQTKRGKIKRKVRGNGTGIQICRRTEVIERCMRVFLIPSCVGKGANGRQSKGSRVTVEMGGPRARTS